MIFDLTKAYVPEAYVDSRDYRTFLRQLGVLLSVFKFNIDHFPDLYDPYECPDHMLPLLATMVGYKYDDTKSLDANRKIIKYFPYLIRNRGSELGIKLATVLCINTDPTSDRSYNVDNIIVDVDVESGLIKIYYPRQEVIDWNLIEVVRPVGMRIELIPSEIGNLNDELYLKVSVSAHRRHEYFDTSKVDASQMNNSVNRRITKDDKLIFKSETGDQLESTATGGTEEENQIQETGGAMNEPVGFDSNSQC